MKTFSSSFKKNLFACLIGPLAILPASIGYALFFKVIEPEANVDNFQLIPLFIIFGLIIAYPVTLLIGLPISVILQKYEQFSIFKISAIVFLGVAISTIISNGGLPDFVFLLYFSLWVSTSCWYLHRVG